MKIAVYTIALNEEKFVERWYNSAKDADYLLIADTGSTDKTVKIAKKLGIHVVKISIKPWRFDDARNAALALLPDDIDMCIPLDMDEVLCENWREILEKTTGTQILYKYTYSWQNNDQTIPGLITSQQKVHARHGYRWKYPVHEYIFPERNNKHVLEKSDEFEILHYPDLDKERTPLYNPLIKHALDENPDSARYQLYYIKALLSEQEIDKKLAIKEIKKFIKMKNDADVLLTDICLSYMYLSELEPRNRVKHLLKAIESWNSREPIVKLAMYYFKKQKWEECEKYCEMALEIKDRITDPNYQTWAWGYLPSNMLYVSRHNKKLDKTSKQYKKNTLKLNPYSITSWNFELFTEDDV